MQALAYKILRAGGGDPCEETLRVFLLARVRAIFSDARAAARRLLPHAARIAVPLAAQQRSRAAAFLPSDRRGPACPAAGERHRVAGRSRADHAAGREES